MADDALHRGKPSLAHGGQGEATRYLEECQVAVEPWPIPRAVLSRHARVGLWLLRVMVTVLGGLVVYAFIEQLH